VGFREPLVGASRSQGLPEECAKLAGLVSQSHRAVAGVKRLAKSDVEPEFRLVALLNHDTQLRDEFCA